MRTLHIIMPMAGEGSRFRNAGWTTPKPLIEVEGKALFMRALESVTIPGATMKYSFIVRQEHIDNYAIDRMIREILPEADIFAVRETTRGAVETCMVAEQNIGDDEAIVVMDCDLEFRSIDYISLITEALSTPSEKANGGALVSFRSTLPKYSYAEIDEAGNVLRTAEKEPISDHALCGAYFFSSGREFKNAARDLINAPVMEKPEFYVSLLYNRLLATGSTVRLAEMELYKSYGTPEELQSSTGK